MDVLTRSYAEGACESRLSAGNSFGGAAEGRSFQPTGPGLNSIRYGGPGLIQPGIHRGGSLDSQARDNLCDHRTMLTARRRGKGPATSFAIEERRRRLGRNPSVLCERRR
jgi:hypothetical protein